MYSGKIDAFLLMQNDLNFLCIWIFQFGKKEKFYTKDIFKAVNIYANFCLNYLHFEQLYLLHGDWSSDSSKKQK